MAAIAIEMEATSFVTYATHLCLIAIKSAKIDIKSIFVIDIKAVANALATIVTNLQWVYRQNFFFFTLSDKTFFFIELLAIFFLFLGF